NPIYAQGMSAAAKQAKILHDILAEYTEQSRALSGIASAFFPKAAEFNSTPWHLSAGFDFAFPQALGTRPPGTEERARYLATLNAHQADDAEISRLMPELFHLLQPLSVLQQEPLRSRVLGQMARGARPR